jgi:hypothetical protein
VDLKKRYEACAATDHNDSEIHAELDAMQVKIYACASGFLKKGYSLAQLASLEKLAREATVFGSDELLSSDERKYVTLKKRYSSASASDSGNAVSHAELDKMQADIAALSRKLILARTPLRRFDQLEKLVGRP